MAVISPFCGIKFNTAKIAGLSDVVTPPYDVIDPNAEAAFLAKSPYNMVRLDLGKKSGITQGEERFARASRLFTAWRDEEILLQDGAPSIYLYFVEYTHPSGARLIRKGLVALVGLAEFSEGVVKPHEKTFAGVRSDRLHLLQACKAQFSQIFSLYPDGKGEIMAGLEACKGDRPILSVLDQDGCRHEVYQVTAVEAIAKAASLFQDRSLYIADGHHRYTTALEYRRRMEELDGPLPPDSPYNFVMMYLCGMEDPGLSVLPTHRLVRAAGEITADALAARLAPAFTVEEISGGERETLVGEVLVRLYDSRGKGGDKTLFGLYHAGEDRSFLLELREGVMAAHYGATVPESLRVLDVVVLSELLLAKLLAIPHDQSEREGLIDYYSDADEALDIAVKEANNGGKERTPLLFLMNPTTVAQVRRVADEGLIMPHKSTYFYPKMLTGLIMRSLDLPKRG